MCCCQEGRSKERQSQWHRQTGGVVEGESPRGRNRKIDREKQITRLTDDSWKLKTFLLEDMLSFSLPAVIPFFLSSDFSFRYSRCMSVCMHPNMTEGVSKATQTHLSCLFFIHTQIHTVMFCLLSKYSFVVLKIICFSVTHCVAL